jgi:hypothetical protein
LLHDVGEVGVFVFWGEEEVLLGELVYCLVLVVNGYSDGVFEGGSLEFLDFVGHGGREEHCLASDGEGLYYAVHLAGKVIA